MFITAEMLQLLLFRTVVGLGVGGEWSAGAALITETWPARHRGKVMAWVQSAFATGYALAAIVAPSVLTRDHQPFIAWDNHQLWAVLVAVPVFVRWRSMTVLIGVGMAVFTLLRLI